MALTEHHFVWLLSHPLRSEEWLRKRLKDGFHIHHLDGNHYNNAPENLILIEGTDHLRLHGIRGTKMRRRWRNRLEEGLDRSQIIQMRFEKLHHKRAHQKMGLR